MKKSQEAHLEGVIEDFGKDLEYLVSKYEKKFSHIKKEERMTIDVYLSRMKLEHLGFYKKFRITDLKDNIFSVKFYEEKKVVITGFFYK